MHEHHKLCFESEADRIIFAVIYAANFSTELRDKMLEVAPGMYQSVEEADCWYYPLNHELMKMKNQKRDRADTVIAMRMLSDIHSEMLAQCAKLVEE